MREDPAPMARKRVGFIEGLFVRADARRRGHARALVRAAEQWARSRGARQMGSDTHLSYRASRAMHRALGYREVEHVVILARRLR